MGLFKQRNQKRVHTTLDSIDYEYCDKHNLKFAHLLRAAIRDHRVHTGDPDAVASARELKRARDHALDHRDKILKVLQDILTKDQYDGFLNKLSKQ